MEGSRKPGLARIVEIEYNKKFSKYNQESNWLRRPLRRGQLHYACLDAVAVLYLVKKVRSSEGPRSQNVRLTNLCRSLKKATEIHTQMELRKRWEIMMR